MIPALLLRLRRAWCAVAHDWTLHRGFWRCAVCQPEKHARREKSPPPDTKTLPLPFSDDAEDPLAKRAPLSPTIEEMSGSVDPAMMDWDKPLGEQPDGAFAADKLQENN